MPNYGLVINSTYNPMSYEQYVAPFREYALVYNLMADTYDALEMEANLWEKLANEQDKSSNAYKTYLKYAADIRAAANDLAENGLSTKTRSSISELKRRYASEIKPIEELYNYRNKLAEEQRKLNPKGDMQWDVDFSNIGLDALATNPTMTYKGRSLAEMEKAGEDVARAASSRRYLSEEAQDMANQYYRVSQGFDGGDVVDFLAKNVNSPAFQELMGLYEQVRTSYGTNNQEESIYSQDLNTIADERIWTGMLKGLAYKEDYQTNYYAKANASGKKTGSGSDDEITYDPIGYAIIVDGIPYTKTNEQGHTVYYDYNNNKYTYQEIGTNERGEAVYGYKNVEGNDIIDFTKQTDKEKKYSEERFATVSAGNKSDVYVVDLWDIDPVSGKPKKITDEHGNVVTYDRNTHEYDSRYKKVVPIKKEEGKVKVPKSPYSGKVSVSNTKGNTVPGGYTLLKNDEIIELLNKLDDVLELTFDDLSSEEQSKLPEHIKAAKDKYVFYRAKEDASGLFTGDNNIIIYKPTSSTIVPANQGGASDDDTE